MYDIAIKDDVSLMDVAPYRLSGKGNTNVIEYALNDAAITVRGGAGIGLATVKDYDIVIHMVSYLNAEMERYRRGERDTPPERKYRPDTYEILKFLRRDNGGEQYKQLELSLQRLNATTITIIAERSSRRKAKGFSLINDWDVTSKTKTGKIQQVEITIPDWIYDGIVRKEAPTVLTLHQDYFLVSGALDRSLYRLARKCAGKSHWSFSLHDVHLRSGSTQPFRKFANDLRQAFPQKRRILEYDFEIVKTGRDERLEMTYQDFDGQTDTADNPDASALFKEIAPRVKRAAALELVRTVAPDWDADVLLDQWVHYAADKGVPANPMGALRRFAEKKQREKPW